jgi:NMD protein affecting ribosome stability and mRNA decay
MKPTNESLGRMDRLAQEHIHDPYKNRSKLRDPTVCPECNAVFSNGRWQWMESRPRPSRQELCPACHRIRDHYPAGVVTLAGAFAQEHKTELLDLVRHQEEAEKTKHPLHRLMNIEEKPENITITTTDIHLPKRIGNALRHAYKGRLEIHYADEDYFVRLHWTHQP